MPWVEIVGWVAIGVAISWLVGKVARNLAHRQIRVGLIPGCLGVGFFVDTDDHFTVPGILYVGTANLVVLPFVGVRWPVSFTMPKAKWLL